MESEKKVLPSYVLVRMEMNDRNWAVVRNTPGVTGFVGPESSPPSPLTRAEFNKIMHRNDASAGVAVPLATMTSSEPPSAQTILRAASS